MGRSYDIDGVNYPSVTAICGILNSPSMMNWIPWAVSQFVIEGLNDMGDNDYVKRENMINLTRKAAKDYNAGSAAIGTKVHAMIAGFYDLSVDPIRRKYKGAIGVNFDVRNLEVEAVKALMAFLKWNDVYSPSATQNETLVYSEEKGYAGTADMFCTIDGIPTVIDFKTSNNGRMYPEAKYQTAAYRYILKAEKNVIVTLNKKTGEFVSYDVSGSYEKDLEIFFSLLDVFNLTMGDKRW